MGTKIQVNAFLPEYHSAIDLDGNISSGMRSLYHEKQIVQNGHNLNSLTSWMYKNGCLGSDREKVRQTILKHELIFKNQLQELHRLYRRQWELMNEMKRRETKKDDVRDEKSQLSSLFSPIFFEDAKRTWNAPHSLAGCLSTSSTSSTLFSNFPENKSTLVLPPMSKSSILPKRTYDLETPAVCMSNTEKQIQDRFSKLQRSHQASFDRDAKSSLGAVWAPQHDIDALRPNLYFRKTYNQAELNLSNPTNGNSGDLTFARGDVSANSHPNFHVVSNDLFKNSLDEANEGDLRTERSGKEQLSADCAGKRQFDKCSSIGDFCYGKSPTLPESVLAEPRNEIPNSPLDMGRSVSRKRSTMIFGVEFSGGRDDPMDASSNTSNTILKNDLIKSETSPGLKGGLPWFTRSPQYSVEPSEGMKNSYFMNLDSLQNCSEKFFRKSELADGSFQTLKQKKEISPQMAAQDAKDGPNEVNHVTSATSLIDFPISDKVNCPRIEDCSARKVKKGGDVPRNQLGNKDLVLQKGLNSYISDLRHHIDLNRSLDEEAAALAPSLPTAIVKIATAEVDLEAPIATELEADTSLKDANSSKTAVLQLEECERIAADVIISISLFGKNKAVVNDTCECPKSESSNSLKWFAEIVSSLDHSGACYEEESVPDGMDYFEFMTLKLEETKEDYSCHKQEVCKNPSDEEEAEGSTSSRRFQRGQSRRGRPRVDFQKDVLPGLVTLSRHEVAEDLQIFQELSKDSQENSTRNCRGRKRSGGPNVCPTGKALQPIPTQQPIFQLEERSLTGWGKRTRRMPRQRCTNACLSFPGKC